MTRFEALTEERLAGLALRPEQGWFRTVIANAAARAALAAPGAGWRLCDGAVPLGAGGVFPLGWPGRGFAWLAVGPSARPRDLLLAAHFARGWIDDLLARGRYFRIEATVPVDFAAGCSFAKKLGFAPEATMRRFDAEGRDHVLYARVAP